MHDEWIASFRHRHVDGLTQRLNSIHGAISDQAMYLEAELNDASDADAIRAVERLAETSRLLLEHVQTAAWEKAKAIQ